MITGTIRTQLYEALLARGMLPGQFNISSGRNAEGEHIRVYIRVPGLRPNVRFFQGYPVKYIDSGPIKAQPAQ